MANAIHFLLSYHKYVCQTLVTRFFLLLPCSASAARREALSSFDFSGCGRQPLRCRNLASAEANATHSFAVVRAAQPFSPARLRRIFHCQPRSTIERAPSNFPIHGMHPSIRWLMEAKESFDLPFPPRSPPGAAALTRH